MRITVITPHFVRLFLAILSVGAAAADAAEIKVIAANAVKDSLTPIAASFEKASGHRVTVAWGGTEAIFKRIASDDVFDLVLIAGPGIDRLITDGKLVQGSRADFARSGVGVAVRSGLPKPDISSSESVKNAVLAAGSVAYSSGPSGFYLAELFKRLGIAEQVRDKTKQPASGVQVGELLARGEADLGFQQISELLHVKGIDYLGPLPADIQNVTIYAIGLHASSKVPDAARALIKALVAPDAGQIIRQSGMDPP
ncbi:MAG: ABC transporter substrate-binding protein [Betaproteobacteria bacterium]|nr:ABC transporter substrate-binding protein [Betaproteobacteria bacterium]